MTHIFQDPGIAYIFVTAFFLLNPTESSLTIWLCARLYSENMGLSCAVQCSSRVLPNIPLCLNLCLGFYSLFDHMTYYHNFNVDCSLNGNIFRHLEMVFCSITCTNQTITMLLLFTCSIFHKYVRCLYKCQRFFSSVLFQMHHITSWLDHHH